MSNRGFYFYWMAIMVPRQRELYQMGRQGHAGNPQYYKDQLRGILESLRALRLEVGGV